MNIAIYCRKSYYSDTSESTKMQIEACKEYATRFGGHDTIAVYEDEGYIRSDIDRPGMNRLRADINDGLVDCVMVYRIDRITSRMVDFCNFYANLKDRGIKFITVKDGIDTTTPIGEAMMYLAVIFSGIEVEQDTLRITDNLNHLAASGYWCGGKAPLGYRTETVVSSDRKSHKILVVDPDAMAWKNELIDVFLSQGLSLQRMEKYCRDNGIRTKNGKLLQTNQLYTIMLCPFGVQATAAMYDYFKDKGCQMDEGSPRHLWDGSTGIMVYGRTWEPRVDGKKKHRPAPPSNWRVSLAKWAPDMTDTKYFEILDHFRNDTYDKTMKHDTTLLKGVLRCKCGRLMGLARKHHTDGTVVSWYRCPRRDRFGVGACDMQQTSAKILDDKVLEIFKKIAVDPKAIEKYIPEHKKEPADARERGRKALEEVEGKIDRLTSQLAENDSSTAAKYIVKEIEKLDLKAAELRRLISEQSVEDRRAAKEIRSAKEKRSEIIRICEHLDELTATELNELARKVIRECTWDGETLKILF